MNEIYKSNAKLKKLQKEFDQYKRESIKWSIEDFLYQEVEGWSINKRQAQEALEHMIRKHDSSIGINWDSINYWITEYGKRVKKGKKPWHKNNK